MQKTFDDVWNSPLIQETADMFSGPDPMKKFALKETLRHAYIHGFRAAADVATELISERITVEQADAARERCIAMIGQ